MIVLAVLLVLIGVLLTGIEGIVPGFGVFGIGGIICLVWGAFLMTDDMRSGFICSGLLIACLPITIPLVAKGLRKLPFTNRFIRTSALTTEEGYSAKAKENDAYIGKTGRALSALRPSGSVLLEDGTKLDVITRGEYIEKDAQVKVIKAESTWFVVDLV